MFTPSFFLEAWSESATYQISINNGQPNIKYCKYGTPPPLPTFSTELLIIRYQISQTMSSSSLEF